MRRTPLRQLGDMVGWYAYLAAMGGLRYWPALRQAGIADETLPVETDEPDHHEQPVEVAVDPGRERIPAA